MSIRSCLLVNIGLFAITGLVIQASTAWAEPVALRLRWVQGGAWAQRLSMEQKTSSTVGDTVQESIQNLEVDYTLRVESILEDGSAVVTLTYDALKLRQRVADEETFFDSRQRMVPTHPLGKAMNALVGQQLGMRIDPSGGVSDVQGADAIADRLAEALELPDGPEKTALREQFGPGALRQGLEQMLRVYPPEPVDIGSTWSVELKQSESVPVQVNPSFKVTSRQDGVTMLAVAGSLHTDPSTMINAGGMKASHDMAGELSGETHIRESDGMVVRSEVVQRIKGVVTLHDVPGETAPLSIPTSTESRIQLSMR